LDIYLPVKDLGESTFSRLPELRPTSSALVFETVYINGVTLILKKSAYGCLD